MLTESSDVTDVAKNLKKFANRSSAYLCGVSNNKFVVTSNGDSQRSAAGVDPLVHHRVVHGDSVDPAVSTASIEDSGAGSISNIFWAGQISHTHQLRSL